MCSETVLAGPLTDLAWQRRADCMHADNILLHATTLHEQGSLQVEVR